MFGFNRIDNKLKSRHINRLEQLGIEIVEKNGRYSVKQNGTIIQQFVDEDSAFNYAVDLMEQYLAQPQFQQEDEELVMGIVDRLKNFFRR
jgi:hypothetical protein